MIKKYSKQKQGDELPPHVFNIAHDSYYGLTSFKQLQLSPKTHVGLMTQSMIEECPSAVSAHCLTTSK